MTNTCRVAVAAAVLETLPNGLRVWTPCVELANVAFREVVTSAADIEATMRAVGATVARILTARPGFRLEARCDMTGVLMALGEWSRKAAECPTAELAAMWVADWARETPCERLLRVAA
jgi:hypothetical protein